METLRLITIGFSHYCEKARWALDRAGLPWREERYPPALHYRALRGLGVGRQVPVLIHAGGPLGDSTTILQWVDAHNPLESKLYPPDLQAEVEALEDRFDEVLGPHIRRVVYHHGLQAKKVMRWTATQGVGRFDRVAAAALMPFAGLFFGRALGLAPAQIERSKAKVDALLDEVDARVADGRRHLVGPRFTAADLTFASLLAPAFLPEKYGAPLPRREQLPPGYQTWMDDLAARHPAVAFAQRLFAEER